jgi:hypothetical protein
MTPASHPEVEVQERVRPTREQLRVAAAMFAAAPEEVTAVVVPAVVLLEPWDAAGTPAPRPAHPGGYWLADRGTRDGAYSFVEAVQAARIAAEAHLRAHGQRGAACWVTIRPDGSWVALDGRRPAAA